MATEQSAKSKRRDVVQFRREDNVDHVAIGVRGISEETEVAEHPADVNETDDA